MTKLRSSWNSRLGACSNTARVRPSNLVMSLIPGDGVAASSRFRVAGGEARRRGRPGESRVSIRVQAYLFRFKFAAQLEQEPIQRYFRTAEVGPVSVMLLAQHCRGAVRCQVFFCLPSNEQTEERYEIPLLLLWTKSNADFNQN